MTRLDEHPRSYGIHRSGHRALATALGLADAFEGIGRHCATTNREGDHG